MSDVSLVNEEQLLGWTEARKHLRLSKDGEPVADNVQEFAAWLIRTNYIVEVGKLIEAEWVMMSEAELTKHLASKYSTQELEALFSKKSELRQLLKNRARNLSLFAAVAVGLVWAKEDLDRGDYGVAGLKFSGTIGGAYVLNRYFYGRDKEAAQIMARNMGNFGKWFQGVARTNPFVNVLARRVMPAMLIWDLRTVLMSGGIDGPNIPFDFVIHIDIFDRSTWRDPPETMLDLGMDFFYYQKPTSQWPVGHQQECLGVIRGSVLRAPKRWINEKAESVGRAAAAVVRGLSRSRGPWNYRY
jgi:hypothetical protein